MRTMTRVLRRDIPGVLVCVLCVVGGEIRGRADTDVIRLTADSTQQTSSQQARADIYDAMGKMVGQAVLSESANGLQIRLTLIGIPQGTHAFHIHQTGKCDPPGFTTAGAHLNPEHKQHGRDNPMGRHAGDLPNVTVPPSGRLIVENVEPLLTMKAGTANTLFDADGSALVIHQLADDNKTDPDGKAGARIACGVIMKG